MTRIAPASGPAWNPPGTDAGRWRLGRRELLAIAAFWAAFAVLATANRVLGYFGNRPLSTVYEAFFSVLNSCLWAAATPLIFWLAWRFGVERSRRTFSIPLFLGAGAVIVSVMMLVRGFVWIELLHYPPVRAANLSGSVMETLRSPWFLNDLVTYGGVLAVGFTREYFVRYRARLEESARLQAQAAQLRAQLSDARLETLRMQLDPHFLFNTLHAISSLVERDPRGVRRMIARVSELLRYTLQGSNRQEIAVEEEMEFLEKYLEIMQVRFQGHLEIETRVAPEVMRALVPTLIMQPLVENAVKHGVSNRVETGRIEVYAHRADERLVLGVRDNGPGLRGGGGAAEGEGVGLHNVRSRLRQMFGEEQALTLRPAEGGGVVAEIELPLHTRAEVRVGEVAAAPARAAHER